MKRRDFFHVALMTAVAAITVSVTPKAALPPPSYDENVEDLIRKDAVEAISRREDIEFMKLLALTKERR